MNNVLKSILNRKYDYVGAEVLRLYEKVKYITHLKHACQRRTLITFQRFPEISKYYLPCQKYSVKPEMAKHKIMTQHSKVPWVNEESTLYAIIRDSSHYEDTVMRSISARVNLNEKKMEMLCNMNWNLASPIIIYDAIKLLSYAAANDTRLTSDDYDKMLATLATRNILPKYTDIQIKAIIQHMIAMSATLQYLPSYKQCISMLSKECKRRFNSRNVTQLLLMIDCFYQLNTMNCDYVWYALRNLNSKLQSLSAKNLVQFVFYLSYSPKMSINNYELEYYLEKNFAEISLNELGIISRSFFIHKRSIHNKALLKNMLDRITNNVTDIVPVSLSLCLKVLRYSPCLVHLDLVETLLNKLRLVVPSIHMCCISQIAHLAGNVRVYNEDLLKEIFVRVQEEISSMRLKDIDRIIFYICSTAPTTFGESMCKEVMAELTKTYNTTRSHELEMFPRNLVNILLYVSYKKIYPEELLAHVFEPMFARNICRINIQTENLLKLHNSVKIEMPNYTGPFLEERIYNRLVEKYCHVEHVDIMERYTSNLNDIVYCCNKLGLHPYVSNILWMNSDNDIVFGFDEQFKSVPVEDILSKMPFGSIKRVDNLPEGQKKIKWLVLYLLSYTQQVRGHDTYSGYMLTKVRQLEAIGYSVMPVISKAFCILIQDDPCKSIHGNIIDIISNLKIRFIQELNGFEAGIA